MKDRIDDLLPHILVAGLIVIVFMAVASSMFTWGEKLSLREMCEERTEGWEELLNCIDRIDDIH